VQRNCGLLVNSLLFLLIIRALRFPRREDVDRSNSSRIGRLSTTFEPFTANDGGALRDQQREKMLANFMAPAQLNLCIDAQVMLIKNLDDTLVNGTIGKVVDFADMATYVRDGGEVMSGGNDAKKLSAGLSAKRYPVVEFSLLNGDKRRVLITPESWKVESSTGELQVCRLQVSRPLKRLD
jgi:ATP-dependent DNA helicase PIF1